MTLTVRSATVSGATTKGSPLTHAELDENFNHLSQSANHSFTPSGSGAIAETTSVALRRLTAPSQYSSDANYVTATVALTEQIGAKALETQDGSAAAPSIRGITYDTTGWYFASGPKLLGSLGGTRAFEISGTSFFAGPSAGAAITTGVDNIMIGDLAGRLLTDSSRNVIIGNDTARQSATTMTDCVIIGTSAGFANAGADNLVFVGEQAGLSNTSGANNTFVGSSAGKQNTVGGSNTMIGRAAGNDSTTGGFNTYIGHAAAFDYTEGGQNTFVGNQAGNPTIAGTPARTGSDNTGVGEFAGPTLATASNTCCFGHDATVQASNMGKFGAALTDTTLSGQAHSSQDVESVASATGVTYTTDQFHASLILRTGAAGAGFSDTTPDADDLVAAIPGCEVGSGYDLYIHNTTGQTMTLLAGNGITLSGTTTVATGQTRLYKVYATNVTASSEAVTVQGVFTAAN